MDKWFICINEKVAGPFTSDEVKAQFAEGQLPKGCLIWGRSLGEWQSVEWWTKDSSQSKTMIQKKETTQVATSIPPAQQQWHYAVDGASKGPMTRIELLNELRSLKDKSEVLLWTKGMRAWANLFVFHDLLDEMGLNKREHPRASISGSVVIKTEQHAYLGQLKSISQGGLGASQLDPTIPIGQIVHVEMKSDLLGETITAKAIVQYVTDHGYVGFRFSSINMEAKARITEYILRAKSNANLAA